jgi:(1->4)-alpha-D-glucan 1-alpha-D-glucosylmutase
MLSTATHDTKRGEDNRLRIDALSEAPGAWWETVTRWTALNAALRRGTGLDRNTEYLLYQTLVGAWPVERDRLQRFATKAVREAKTHTGWDDPVEAYEAGLRRFIDGLFANQAFMANAGTFVASIDGAARLSSLSQTLIKLTAPGVPDIYQGCELWDHSLVDPDNRRPVDYGERRRLLARAKTLDPHGAMREMASGLPKLLLIWKTLALRKKEAAAFGSSYEPLYAAGAKGEHVIAFMRGGRVITVAPRWSLERRDGWADTSLALPEGSWRNELTGARFVGGASVALGDLLRDFAVALLVKE